MTVGEKKKCPKRTPREKILMPCRDSRVANDALRFSCRGWAKHIVSYSYSYFGNIFVDATPYCNKLV